jgi:hypothetical protein
MPLQKPDPDLVSDGFPGTGTEKTLASAKITAKKPGR